MAVSKPSISYSHKLVRNIRPWGRKSPTYIVIHFTGGCYSTSDTLSGMSKCYEAYLATHTNAHYLVGRNAIWEMVNPKLFYCTASCGAGVGKSRPCKIEGWGPSVFKGSLSMSHATLAGHSNTINIEICSCKAGVHNANSPMDAGWYFNDATYVNAVHLCAWLCDEFSIKINNIIMHNQVTGKLCPAMWCNKDGAEAGFLAFKQAVAAVVNEVEEDTPISPNPEPASEIIQVAAGSVFHSRPNEDSPIVGIASGDVSLVCTLTDSGYSHTDMGWVLT